MHMEGQVGQFDFLVGMEYGQAGEVGVSAATGLGIHQSGLGRGKQFAGMAWVAFLCTGLAFCLALRLGPGTWFPIGVIGGRRLVGVGGISAQLGLGLIGDSAEGAKTGQ